MVLFVCCILLASELHAQSFPVFDALLYTGKPDLTQQGLSPMRMIYSSEIWADSESRDNPNQAMITAVAKQLNASLLTCVDIENWPTAGTPAVLKPSLAKYKSVLALIKAQKPAIKIGYYSVLPRHDYYRALKAKGQRRYDDWRRENVQIKDLAGSVDVIFPDLYTFSPDQASWVTYAVENIKQARQYGKPVYAFLWPMYHDSTPYAGTYLTADYWRLELETCYQYADGIVIWGGWQEQWNQNAPWWIETQKFLQRIQTK